MNSVPIFDSLTHPMPDGSWLTANWNGENSIESLRASMEENNIQWALAVGMGAKVGGYEEDRYASYIRSHSDKLFPVAFVDFEVLNAGMPPRTYLRRLRTLGYVGIKIHPRLSRIGLSNELLPMLIREANQLGLCVLLCTYFWGRDKSQCENTPEHLHALLCEVPDEKVILLHGGAVRLLEVAEIARQFPGTLLDLSFTICKYEGSSLDLDIKYLFEKFDRRLCIGSDSPEFNQRALRNRFEFLAEQLSEEKKNNIAFRNIQTHIGEVS